MNYRGFMARWYIETWDATNSEWLRLSKYIDGTWEEAVTWCANFSRLPVFLHSAFRVSSTPVVVE